MIRKLLGLRRLVRNAIGFATTIFKLGISDPRGFALNFLLKLEPRLHLRENYDFRKFLSRNLGPSELLEKQGEIRENLIKTSLARSKGFRRVFDYLAFKRIQRANERFSLDIIPSVNRAIQPDNENILLYLTNSLPYTQSGYTLRSQNLYSALASRSKVNVLAVTRYGYPWSIGSALPRIEDVVGGVRYVRILPIPFFLKPDRAVSNAVDAVVSLCKQNGITLLHTTTDFSNALVVSRAAAELGIPWIYEVRGEPESTWLASVQTGLDSERILPPYFEKSRFKEDEAIRSAWRVIALSETSLAKLRTRGHNGSKFKVIPNGFHSRLLEPTQRQKKLRQEANISDEAVLIGVISSIVKYEGIDILIKALALLPSRYEVVIIGAGEHLNSLKKVARDYKVDSRIVFLGAVPEAEAMSWYQELDVFCVPRIDSEVTRSVTPLKSLPASALKLPIVASDLPALREATGGYAHFFEPQNPDDLAKTILTLDDSNYDLEAGRRWAESRTWTALGEKLARVYEGT